MARFLPFFRQQLLEFRFCLVKSLFLSEIFVHSYAYGWHLRGFIQRLYFGYKVEALLQEPENIGLGYSFWD